MDRPIEHTSRLKKKYMYYITGGLGVIAVGIFLFLQDTSSTMKIEREKLSIATVIQGEFNDYIRVIGQVVPSRIVYLDAIEGGRVEERYIEEGTWVRKGDVILRLSNPLLNIGILQSEGDISYQENELRNTRISMEQEHLSLQQEHIGMVKDVNQKKRRLEQFERLVEEQLIAREEYLIAKENYESAVKQLQTLEERIKRNDVFRATQLESLDENIVHMKRSLALVRERIENLNVKAPIDGQLGILEAEIGQSIAQGERIGQIITADLKIQAFIDEHYVERVHTGLPGSFERDDKSFQLDVAKVYPEVRDGQFRTDFVFTAGRPENIRAGQTYHINLQLGDPVASLLLPKGSFFQSSSGQYVYVLDSDGQVARKRMVRIGRQNPAYYEVISGLEIGEEVIISGYELFGMNERLLIK